LAGYEYAATIPAANLREGPYEFVVTVYQGVVATTFPGGAHVGPSDWNYNPGASWRFDVVSPATALRLFDPAGDALRLTFTRIGDAGRRGLFRVAISPVTGQQVFHFELPVDTSGWSPADYSASLVVKDRILARRETINDAQFLRMRVRGLGARQTLHVTLMEDDGTSWTAPLTLDTAWAAQTIPLASFKPGRGVLLPQGFPGEWNYWVGPAAGRGANGDKLRVNHLERLQLSLRREDGTTVKPGNYGIEIEWVTLGF